MASTYIEHFESEICPKCQKKMIFEVCGAIGMWVCFECKEFKKHYNSRFSQSLGKLINKILK